jgi:hypothetical protein
MGWRDHAVFKGYWKAMKRPNHLARLLEMVIEELGTSESFREEDLRQAVRLFDQHTSCEQRQLMTY